MLGTFLEAFLFFLAYLVGAGLVFAGTVAIVLYLHWILLFVWIPLVLAGLVTAFDWIV